MSEFKFMTILVSAIVGLFLLIGLVCRFGAHAVEESSCYSFAEQSGRVTKFVDYNFFSWGCLTPAKDGKWIDVHLLRDEVN